METQSFTRYTSFQRVTLIDTAHFAISARWDLVTLMFFLIGDTIDLFSRLTAWHDFKINTAPSYDTAPPIRLNRKGETSFKLRTSGMLV